MNKKIIKRIFLVVVVLVGSAIYFHAQQSYSANLTSVSVTLSNSRPSFRGLLAAGNTVSSSSVTIATTGAPSITTDQLVQGDELLIGNSSTLSAYDVTEVVDNNTFNIIPALGAGDADAGDEVIATSSATLTAAFTTATAVNNGAFRLLVPAEAVNADSKDGIPDAGYFDFTSAGPTVTCPDPVTNYTFAAGASAESNVTIDGTDYHSFTCSYTGTGAIGTSFTGMEVDSLINPAPPSTHVATGTADAYTLILQHLDSGNSVVDQTAISVGTIEAVRVTAEVAPIITFEIAGVAASQTACGNTTSVITTAAAVPFGELLISSFKHAAQIMTVSTNASGGYAVTALANDQMGRNGGTCAGDNTGSDCIPDSVGNDSVMSDTNEDDWNSTTVKGFAYSLDSGIAGATAAFEYDSTTNGCSGGVANNCFRQFADAESSEPPVQIFSSTGPADGHAVTACYKAVISSTQAAGNYENYITYTATATF